MMNQTKQHYFLKLIPVRPTFSQDMNDEERAVMMQHIAYWQQLMTEGIVVVYGPVMDPAGGCGVGIIEVDDEEQVIAITRNDPAAAINTYQYFPMRAIVPGK